MSFDKLTKHKNNIKTLKRNSLCKTQEGGGYKKGSSRSSSRSSSRTKINEYVYLSSQISTQQNADINYKEIGVIHITESGAVNVLTKFATGIANLFGSKGFDNSIYDKARNSALKKLIFQVKNNQKVCNLRMDIENLGYPSSLFFVHLYGTLLEKIVKM